MPRSTRGHGAHEQRHPFRVCSGQARRRLLLEKSIVGCVEDQALNTSALFPLRFDSSLAGSVNALNHAN